MDDVSRILGMNVLHDREKEAITISQKYYTEDVVQRYGIEGFNPAYAPGVEPELSLDQPEEKLLNTEEKRRHQAITRAVMHLAQVTRCNILGAVNRLVRAMSKPAKAHMGAAKHLLCYLVGSTVFSITSSRVPLGLLAFRIPTGATTPTTAGIRHHTSHQLYGGTVGADRTVHDGGRARSGSSGNEGGGVLLQHDVGAGLS